MRTRPAHLRLLATASVLLAAGAAAAADRDLVLGAAGEIYQARLGTYSELFPGDGAAAAEAPVVALDVIRPNETARRLLVPGTEGDEVESSPFLLFEDATHSVFVLWQSTVSYIHPILRLASFDGSQWSEPIEITGNPFARKSAPRLAVTRDRYADAEGAEHARTVLHLVWAEETGAGDYESYYTPVILLDGVYLGWNPVFALASLDSSPVGVSAADTELLSRLPFVGPGRDGRTAVVGFTSASTGRLTTVEVDVLPQPLVQLADRARHQIIHVGLRSTDAEGLRQLAAEVKSALLAGSPAFEPEVLKALVAGVEETILGGLGSDLYSLAERARHQIIHVGSRLTNRGLRTVTAATFTQEVSRDSAGDAPLLQFRVVASWTAPELPGAAEGVRVLVSESAGQALVAWPVAGSVRYRQTVDDDWSPERELRLSGQISLTRAFEVLEQRLRGR